MNIGDVKDDYVQMCRRVRISVFLFLHYSPVAPKPSFLEGVS